MGQVRSRIVRPFKNYNVEHRAEKILEKRQTVPESAPKHETTVKKFDRFREGKGFSVFSKNLILYE